MYTKIPPFCPSPVPAPGYFELWALLLPSSCGYRIELLDRIAVQNHVCYLRAKQLLAVCLENRAS